MARGLALVLSQLWGLLRQPAPASTQQPYPKLRNFILDVMAEGRRKNTINLLFEAEVAPMRRHLAAQAERISLTSYIARTLACAVNENRSMHAYRRGRSRLTVFEDIDLTFMVERDIGGGAALPLNYIVRAAQRKAASGIHAELQAAKTAPLGQGGPLTALEKRFFGLPRPLRRIVWFFIRRDPVMFKDLVGTVGITSMGMHAQGAAIVLPITPMTLTLSIGSIAKRLVLENGQPVEREFIQLNLGADHDIIDGAPLMRFCTRFKAMLEAGCALEPPHRHG
ncbi:2-oxo acid dehydrogenase subunit E2 [Comamonas endophytica]|uniref:2-oxo acid dehydrogenase subunit E2 n=1 Tax=Comamonas endophytica TaxID=2949090 RepID=A0ABY6GFF4_9BURK|nr:MULTISPECIES: 2-oxo acid dehydrogenase subunit E2 [unclassified Acidovorax]MCD2512435.1 2-oxo acid dehydrogenase subunit E2 [Acidovorax sp. D4N7]UYG53194.1 2-oxo acid dehydrogenase subunit E2 [Acidovorax sp. 5MLIR]